MRTAMRAKTSSLRTKKEGRGSKSETVEGV
jgi:hypothetical protein